MPQISYFPAYLFHNGIYKLWKKVGLTSIAKFWQPFARLVEKWKTKLHPMYNLNWLILTNTHVF